MTNYQTINSFLLFVLLILVGLLYLMENRTVNEAFEPESGMNSSMESSENTATEEEEAGRGRPRNRIDRMFDDLTEMEKKCDEMEIRQERREREEQAHINKLAKQQYQIQQKKIKELKNVIEHLKIEQKKRQQITEKCRANTQYKLNRDTKFATNLGEQGMLDRTDTTLNLNVSDSLKEILKTTNPLSSSPISNVISKMSGKNSSAPPRYSYDQCPGIDTDKYVHISQLGNKCVGCDPKRLLEKSNYIHKNFN